MLPETPVPFLLLSGPPGAGKTTVAWEIFDRLIEAGHPPALVDLDLLGACSGAPEDDPHNERLKARNLGAVWQHYQAAGARCLIAAGVIESRAHLELYARAVPGAVATLCLLRASNDELRSRIEGRGRERGDGVERLAHRAVQLSAELDVADFCVDTSGHDVTEVGRLILTYGGGWPG